MTYNIGLVADLPIGFNVSGMHTQINQIDQFTGFSPSLRVSKINMWDHKDVDLYHVFGVSPGLSPLLNLCKSKSIPYIVSPNFLPRFNHLFERGLSLIQCGKLFQSKWSNIANMLNGAERIIVNSNMEADVINKAYGLSLEKFLIIPNTYGDAPSQDTSLVFSKKHMISKDYALLVGQIDSLRKNQLGIIKNWTSELIDLVLIGGIGSSSYAKECLEVAKTKSNVKFVGFEADQTIIDSAIKNSKVFISPGLVETPSIAAMRAVMMGVPLVSTNGGGTKDYFEHICDLVSPNEPALFVSKVKDILASTYVEQSITNKEFELKYSKSNILKLYNQAYLEIC